MVKQTEAPGKPEAEQDEPAGEPPAPPQDAPQPATGPRKADGREKIPPAAETPTEGRTGPQEQPETAGQDKPPAPSSQPSTDAEERAEPDPLKDIVQQLESLCEYCKEMGQKGVLGRAWTVDVSALEFAINRLKW